MRNIEVDDHQNPGAKTVLEYKTYEFKEFKNKGYILPSTSNFLQVAAILANLAGFTPNNEGVLMADGNKRFIVTIEDIKDTRTDGKQEKIEHIFVCEHCDTVSLDITSGTEKGNRITHRCEDCGRVLAEIINTLHAWF